LKGNKEIEQMFSDKLKGFEADVRPELWGNIASQIGTAAIPIAGGASFLSKIIIGTVASVIIGGVVFLNSTDKEQSVENIITESIIDESETNTVEKEHSSDPFTKPAVGLQKKPYKSVTILSLEEPVIEEEPLMEFTPPLTIDVETQTSPPPFIEEVKKSEELIDETTPLKVDTKKKETEETIEIENYTISKMPDVFSPNNDGVNDFFFVTSEGLSDFNIVIMNSRNETVYQSQNTKFNWDGRALSGEKAPEGKYVYFIIAKDRKGNVVKKHSLLTIVR